MYRENGLAQASNQAGKYSAPDLKVLEIKNRRVICTSDGITSSGEETEME